MRPSKIRVAKYEHSATSKWVVEGLKNNKGNALGSSSALGLKQMTSRGMSLKSSANMAKKPSICLTS